MGVRVVIIAIMATLMSVVKLYAQDNTASMNAAWDRANTAYVNANYQESIAIYDSIIKVGYVSEKLYYNLGNAYFKEGKIGLSILNYNRALRLAPSDRDIKYNLKVANSYVVDEIEEVPEFFLTTWMRSMRESLSSNSLALLSLLLAAISLGAVLLYLLSRSIRLRKVGFYVAIFGILSTIITISFSNKQKQQQINSTHAIVIRTSAAVKSSPDNDSKDIFILHEGTKVKIVSLLNGWQEISIADGNKGWIDVNAIEVI